MIGCSPSLSVATASRSIRFAMSAFGERDKVQETTIVEAVDHRGKPALVPVHGELGDVRDPQHVRRVGVEVPLHEVRRGLADLAA